MKSVGDREDVTISSVIEAVNRKAAGRSSGWESGCGNGEFGPGSGIEKNSRSCEIW